MILLRCSDWSCARGNVACANGPSCSTKNGSGCRVCAPNVEEVIEKVRPRVPDEDLKIIRLPQRKWVVPTNARLVMTKAAIRMADSRLKVGMDGFDRLIESGYLFLFIESGHGPCLVHIISEDLVYAIGVHNRKPSRSCLREASEILAENGVKMSV
jgi:hypothetical protein